MDGAGTRRDLEEARDSFVDAAGRLVEGLGLSGVAGRLYALLYLGGEVLSLEEMAERLGISKGTVSRNVRLLELWNAVRKVWVKGNRRDHYVADEDVWRVAASRMRAGLERRINEVHSATTKVDRMLISSGDRLDGEERKLADTYRERVAAVEDAAERMRKLMKLVPGSFEPGRT